MTEAPKKRGRPRKTPASGTPPENAPDVGPGPHVGVPNEEPVYAIVSMWRELQPGQTGPTTADVHRDEVENWKRAGWRLA